MEIDGRGCEKIFPNGDVYFGDCKGMLPHGKGKYKWSDGTVYEGDWEEGKMTGKGKIFWPSRVSYEGDFSGGYLHGSGTYIGSDGSIYQGSFKMSSENGIGKKQFPNSDVYEGCWREGVREGSGRYAWSNGNIYIGHWKNGKMSGRGVMKWFNGDLFDGVWSNGLRHGSGFYRFGDGSYYFGIWTKGLKDGPGTFYPAGSKCNLEGQEDKRKKRPPRNSSTDLEESLIPNVGRSLSKITSSFRRGSGRFSLKTTLDDDLGCSNSVRETHGGETDLLDNGTVAYERQYVQGVLINERIRNISKLSHKTKERLKFAKEVKRSSCFDFFEGQRSYYLMLSLQLGISQIIRFWTTSQNKNVFSKKGFPIDSCTLFHKLLLEGLLSHGLQVEDDYFEFFKLRLPLNVVRNLRELFKLNAADYMMSICGDDGLREISSPGKSGSLFYVSHDDRFVIKTLKKSELKVRFVVMGNMFFTEVRIHRRYDLKGSSQGRFTNKDEIDESTTLKDLDLTYEFHMDRLLHESLFRQLSLDSAFLESQQIIDYSLLLGLHFSAPEHLKSLLEHPDSLHTAESTSTAVDGELLIPPKSLLLVTHDPGSVSPTPGPHIRGSTLRAYSIGNKEADLYLPGTGRLRVQLGVNMPAQANHKLVQVDETDSSEAELFEVYDVVLYLGIIDILQEYNLKKKLEHTYKSTKFDPMSISVLEPKLYSKRFIDFLHRIFPLQP
ncbi:hypothetical protein DH2020_045096 [Rehmannia glutinosa]|uniref:Phosphatidylinositol 4-phosphate 5-kinase n=1 Tax=Rehmannia glutinosa TaxID=99300 RepID=A0ABR0UF53_REHGL